MRELKKSGAIYKGGTFYVLGFFLFVFVVLGISSYFYFQGSSITGNYAVDDFEVQTPDCGSSVGSCCNIITQGSYTLTQNIEATACIDVRASNVTFDCQGYKINYGDASTANGFGINIVNVPNVTIKNCVLNQSKYLTNNDNAIAINISGSDNSTIVNLTAYCYRSTPIKDCLAINGLNGLSFSNSVIYANGSAAVGINFVNNSVFNNITTVLSGNAYSINFTNSFGNTFTNSRFSGMTNNFVSLASNNASILNSYFYSAGLGLSLMNSYNWNLSGNSIYNVTRGIYALNVSNLSISIGNISAVSYSLEIWNSTPVNISNIWLSSKMYFNSTNVTFRNIYLANNSADASTFNTSYYLHYDLISINGSVARNTTNNIFIQPNLSSVVITNLPEFNVTANLSFFVGTGLLNRVPTNTTTICNTSTCLNYIYNSLTGISTFDVLNFNPGFTNYSIGSVDLSICNNINYPGSYSLLNEVQGRICINVTSSNVNFDCQGYKINYSAGNAIGEASIVVNSVNNITLKNCILNQTSLGGLGSFSYGITGININNLTITNFTIYLKTSSSYGINFDSVNFSYINNSTFINDIGSISDAVSIFTANVNFLVINNVTIFSGLGVIFNGSFNNITNSKINITSVYGNYAISITNGANNSILNNVIYSNAITSTSCPISFTSTNNNGNIFTNNIISCPACNAVCTASDYSGTWNSFNNNIIRNSLLGFSFSNSINWSLINNSIYNVTRGIYLSNTTNITIDGGNISSTSYSIEARNSTSVNISNIYLSRLMFFNNTNATLRNFYLVNNSADASSFSKGYYIYYPVIGFNNSVQINTTNWLFIQPNLLGVVSENLSLFNTTANLSLFAGTGYATASIQKNGADCNSTYCMNVSYSTTTGYVTFIVDSFSNYSAVGSGSSTPAAAAAAASSSSSAGGATSGTSAGATASASNMWASVVSGTTYTYELGKSDIAISGVTFVPTEALSNVKIAVKEYSAKPAAVANAPEGTVFKYNEISATSLTNEQIQSASIKFDVDKSWIDAKGAKEGISLFRNNNGVWEKLTTRFIGESNGKYQYEAVTPGFSYFAITYTGAVQSNANEPAPVTEPTAAATAPTANPEQPVSEAPISPKKSSSSDEDFLSKNSTLIFIGMGVGFVILFIIIISIVIIKKKKAREEEEEEETKAIAKKAEEAKQKAEEEKAAAKKAEEAKAEALKTEAKAETPKEEPKKEDVIDEEEEHLTQMYNYIEECIKNNIPLEEAKMNLVNQGWVKKEVERAAGVVIIQDYIQKSIKSGFDKTTINNALLKKGWPAKLINEAYKKI